MKFLQKDQVVTIQRRRTSPAVRSTHLLKRYIPALWLLCILVSEAIYPVQAETAVTQGQNQHSVENVVVKQDQETPTPTQVIVTPTLIPTAISITATSVVEPSPTLVTPAPVTSLNADVLFDMVNQFRAQNGRPAFVKDNNVCSIAAARAPQVYDEVYVHHDMHAGLFAMHLPYYVTENIIYYNTEQGALNWWENSPIHRSQMLGNFKYSCTACSGKACSQVFTNY